jgi:hypothetical protein
VMVGASCPARRRVAALGNSGEHGVAGDCTERAG